MDSSQKKILGAFLVGAILVGAALYIKNNQTPEPVTEDSLAVVNKSNTPRARIEVTDSDNDGVPDWQEALQRTDPVILSEVEETYEPETMTEEFSVDFFQDMMLSSNYGAFGSSPEEIAKRATTEMANQAVDELYGADAIILSENNTPLAIKVYANQLAQIVLDNTVPADSLNEAELLRQAYTLDDPEILAQIDPIAEMYKDMIDRSLTLSVPSNYAKEHLDLINVYNAVYNDILAMKHAFSDPLHTVVRLKRYQEDTASLYVALLNLQKKMLLEGINFTEADPAYRFIVQ